MHPGKRAGSLISPENFRADLFAGATVALVGLPQCLAYAAMSGLPPAYGLTTAAVPGLVAAIAGRSPHVITGPTNTTGLLVLGALVPFLDQRGVLRADGLAWMATLTLLCGVLRLGFALAGGASLVRFLPESVLAGFTVGVGILIGTMQIDEALGLPPVSGAGLWAESRGLLAWLASGHYPAALAAAVTIISIAAVAIGRRVSPRLPAALILVIGSSFFAWSLQLSEASGLPLVGDRAAASAAWPPGALPDIRLASINRLLLPASAIVLLGTLELLVSIRAEEPKCDARREMVAQGLANVAGAFTAAFPASASLTRSALLRLGSPQSRLAAASAAVFIMPVLLFGSAIIDHIPQATLAGVLLATAWNMVRRPELGRMWKASHASRLLVGVTLISTLVLPLAWAVFVGAGLGLVIHLARTSQPRLRALKLAHDRLVPVQPGEAPSALVIEVSGSLHYAAVQPFLERFERELPPAVHLVILDLSHAHELRFTALRALEWLAGDLSRRGVELRLAGVTPEVRDLIERAGSHLAYTMWDPEPGRSARRSLDEYERSRPSNRS
jgi:SulP family sulfate permease